MVYKMDILPLCFTIFQFCGFWRPINYTSWSKFLYNCYTVFVTFCIYSFTLSQAINSITVLDDVNNLTNNTFMLVTMISVCCKIANILVKREAVINAINMFLENFEDLVEQKIKKKYDLIAWSVTRNYSILVTITVICYIVIPLVINDIEKRVLPNRAWYPYDLSSLTLFWLSYVHQSFALASAAFINVANDTFIPGLMIQNCAQLEILEHRVEKLIILTRSKKTENETKKEYKEILEKCIRYHNRIIKFAKIIEKMFEPVIFVQFFVTVLTLCSSMYQLSRHSTLIVEIINLIFYLISMLFQLFFYCHRGNELFLKSIEVGDNLYKMDWLSLRPSRRKDLLIIMIRTNKPIQLTIGGIITLSFSAYISILKASYSVFNLLQQTSEK
ncbi:Odorant receptor 42 [Cephus cinctus]|nr:Odorant receptor 42 [Cephus cinctus]